VQDLLSNNVVAAIADQYRRAAQDAAHDFADQRADEDSLTGALGAALRRFVEGQAIDERGIALAWKTHLVKVRGRGRGAGEKTLGADAFLEFIVLGADQQPLRRKLLAVQAKKQWSKTDRRLASQVEAMQRIGQACLVVDYTPDGYFAIEGDAVLRAGGSARKLQARERINLGDVLAERFLRCKIGTVGATYDVERQRLLGTVPDVGGLPAWAPLVVSTIVGPAMVKRSISTRAVRDRPPVPGAGTGPEFTTVESPFIDQLVGMGWKPVTGNLDEPSATGRETFREVLIKSDLRKAIERINLRDGKPWLDDARISQAVSALERIAAPKLIEANQQATELLLQGLAVEGLPDWDQGRSKTVHYIDWEHPENNTFTVMNQFRVDCPGGMAKGFIVPDLVLFVNGIPLVVVECKSPGVAEPLPSAVDQLRRYSNQRKAAGEIEDNEGNERLFHTNQFFVATSFDETRAGTIGADLQHYLEWKDTAPVPLGDVARELDVDAPANLSSQQKLVAGMLRPAHLLDIVRHFTLFQPVDGRTIKVVCRYQQFRAVQAAVHRLLTGKTREQDGEHDRRGGLIWHTQGSGKSLTMMFLVRKLRSFSELRRFKVVLVTDRTDLQDQLSETAALTGETVKVANSVVKVKQLLAQKGPALVFAMIQKYAERDAAASEDESDGPGGIDPGTFPVLNEDASILVMVDEAHRSHASALHGNLLNALPNCARIGFTGTPIIMGAKKRTHDIFGEFLDRYTLKESEADGATVPILYEGRTAEGAVADGRDLDQLFEDLFAERPVDELEAIKRKYATKGHVLEAPKLIEAKARDILRHYVENILPNGLKAQVVAYSRLAAIRYTAALVQARDELVAEAEALEPKLRDLDDASLESKPRKVRAAVRAWRSLPMLRQIEFATIISGGNNDDPAWKEWTDSPKVKARIARFKKPLGGQTDKTDPLAFLVVKSMLLTGFDAPVEGVMYLDRPIREAELLQAIARVNRTGHGKKAGIIVDYYGVARHLKEALSAYAADDVDGVLRSLKDVLPKLRDQHHRVIDVFLSRGVDDLDDPEAAIQLLANERLRAEFTVKLKKFLDTLDLVLPRPEGLPYVKDAKRLSFIYTRARNLYRDGMPTLGKSVGAKVRKLIDEHVISLGVDPKIAPISITDAHFAAHVEKQVSPRAKASEMEHAARHHIRQHLDEDPVHYGKLSERLEEILKTYGENWKQLALALSAFVGEVERGRKADDTGLDPQTQAPFFAILKEERLKHHPVTASDATWLAGLTVQLVATIRAEIGVVGFWKNAHAQEVLRGAVFTFLDDHEIVPFDSADAVADRLLELAKANHAKLVKS
jgi:type I restriction enzyme R subunit